MDALSKTTFTRIAPLSDRPPKVVLPIQAAFWDALTEDLLEKVMALAQGTCYVDVTLRWSPGEGSGSRGHLAWPVEIVLKPKTT